MKRHFPGLLPASLWLRPRPGPVDYQSLSGTGTRGGEGRGREPVWEGSSIKADCGQRDRACPLCERRGLSHCRALEVEGAAESRSVRASSQNKAMGAGSTWDRFRVGCRPRPPETDPRACEARPWSRSGSITCIPHGGREGSSEMGWF